VTVEKEDVWVESYGHRALFPALVCYVNFLTHPDKTDATGNSVLTEAHRLPSIHTYQI
jgi:hypothetical protein